MEINQVHCHPAWNSSSSTLVCYTLSQPSRADNPLYANEKNLGVTHGMHIDKLQVHNWFASSVQLDSTLSWGLLTTLVICPSPRLVNLTKLNQVFSCWAISSWPSTPRQNAPPSFAGILACPVPPWIPFQQLSNESARWGSSSWVRFVSFIFHPWVMNQISFFIFSNCALADLCYSLFFLFTFILSRCLSSYLFPWLIDHVLPICNVRSKW